MARVKFLMYLKAKKDLALFFKISGILKKIYMPIDPYRYRYRQPYYRYRPINRSSAKFSIGQSL